VYNKEASIPKTYLYIYILHRRSRGLATLRSHALTHKYLTTLFQLALL